MNKKELKIEMLRNGDTGATLASQLDMTETTFSAKINGKAEFSQNQIKIIKQRYNLTPERINKIFFDEEVS